MGLLLSNQSAAGSWHDNTCRLHALGDYYQQAIDTKMVVGMVVGRPYILGTYVFPVSSLQGLVFVFHLVTFLPIGLHNCNF